VETKITRRKRGSTAIIGKGKRTYEVNSEDKLGRGRGERYL